MVADGLAGRRGFDGLVGGRAPLVTWVSLHEGVLVLEREHKSTDFQWWSEGTLPDVHSDIRGFL